jgi:uncharacterized membrane protein
LIFEQVLDYRAGDQLVTYINNAMNGNGIFVQTNFAGGCHCAWEYFYGGHGRAPELFDLDGYNQNIYQWMTRQLVNKNSVNPSNILQLQSKKKRKFILQF